MNVNDLKYYVEGARKIARNIDDDNYIYSYKKAPMVSDWKSEGFKIESVLINDLVNWLCYLGLTDGHISDNEVEFINYCLDLNYTKDQIRELANSKLDKDFKNQMPVSFVFFFEAEIVDKNLMRSHSVPIYSENLFSLFGVLGGLFVSCGGKITNEEETLYNEYLELLWQNLTNFKERRGIDETYDNLVGEDVIVSDITVKSNSNKKVTDKMNLVLKLLSQGYSFYDLTNIALISTDIIAKWFYLGSLGDKNFEEFYSKCIKLNPEFEIDMEDFIEHIDIINVNEDIFNNKDNELKSKSKTEINKHKSTSKQKNHIYKLEVNKLKSQFPSKEENTRNLIEKCFPAPQMTNSKFNSHVDECSKIFYDKLDVVMTILDSKTNYTIKLDDEIKLNIKILKEITGKIDSLYEELLINRSKSTNNDVENVLEDMGRLIDSVKYY